MNKLWFSLLILILCSCSSVREERNNFINEELKSKLNKKLELPFISGKISSHKYKIVSFINGDCPSCIDHLGLWKDFTSKINCKDSVVFIMYFCGSNYEYLDVRVKSLTNIGVLFVKDEERIFLKKNNLTDSEMLNTFVADKNSKVLLMGNPVLNKQLGQLYLKLIKGEIEN